MSTTFNSIPNPFSVGERVRFIKGVQRGGTLHFSEVVGTIDSFIRDGAAVKYRGRLYFNTLKCLNSIQQKSFSVQLLRAIADDVDAANKKEMNP